LHKKDNSYLSQFGQEVFEHVLEPAARFVAPAFEQLRKLPAPITNWIAGDFEETQADREKEGPSRIQTSEEKIPEMPKKGQRIAITKAMRRRAAAKGAVRAAAAKRALHREEKKIERKVIQAVAPNLVRPTLTGRQPRKIVVKNNKSSGVTMKGRDFVGTAGDWKDTAGTAVLDIEITPDNEDFATLNILKRLYERYKLRGQMEYMPGSANTRPGSIMGYFERDVTDELESDLTLRLQNAARHESSGEAQIWKPKSWRLPRGEKAFYYCDTPENTENYDIRNIVQARFRALIQTTSDADTTPGAIYFRWSVTFWQPRLIPVPSSLVIPDWSYAFTASGLASVINFDLPDASQGGLPPGAWNMTYTTNARIEAKYEFTDPISVVEGSTLHVSYTANNNDSKVTIDHQEIDLETSVSCSAMTGYGDSFNGDTCSQNKHFYATSAGQWFSFTIQINMDGDASFSNFHSLYAISINNLPNTSQNRAIYKNYMKLKKQQLKEQAFRKAMHLDHTRDIGTLFSQLQKYAEQKQLALEPVKLRRTSRLPVASRELSDGGMGLDGATKDDYDIINASPSGPEAGKTMGPGVPIGKHDLSQDEKGPAREADTVGQGEQKQRTNTPNQAQRVASAVKHSNTADTTIRRSIFGVLSGLGGLNESPAAGAGARSASLK
jgi:hypothetical protein